jgi:hypothetical protein
MGDDLYVSCPRCRGSRQIVVCTDPGNDFRPSQWECVGCPLCHQTGEADANLAAEWVAERAEREAV